MSEKKKVEYQVSWSNRPYKPDEWTPFSTPTENEDLAFERAKKIFDSMKELKQYGTKIRIEKITTRITTEWEIKE